MKTITECNNVLFLDIETVPQYQSFNDCPDEVKALWKHKAGNLRKNESEEAADCYPRAGIYAEFGRIICISTGIVRLNDDEPVLRIKSFFGDDEKLLLQEFSSLLYQHFSRADCRLCAHNGKEFDFPYIARRMVINNIALPPVLDCAGKKPWEIGHIDTMELWKFGDFKSYTPLNLLTHVLGVGNPKDDIDGSQVYSVYWDEKDLKRIVSYCEKDVAALVNVYLRMKGCKIIPSENIFKV